MSLYPISRVNNYSTILTHFSSDRSGDCIIFGITDFHERNLSYETLRPILTTDYNRNLNRIDCSGQIYPFGNSRTGSNHNAFGRHNRKLGIISGEIFRLFDFVASNCAKHQSCKSKYRKFFHIFSIIASDNLPNQMVRKVSLISHYSYVAV